MGVGDIGYAPAVPTPTDTNANVKRLRLNPSRELTGPLFLRRCDALAFLNELLDSLPTFLSYAFVEIGSISVPSGFAAFLSTLLADLFIELVAVGVFGRQSTFATDLFVELGAVLVLYSLAAFLAGFTDGHSAAAPVLFRNP